METKPRCGWVNPAERAVSCAYHDREWGHAHSGRSGHVCALFAGDVSGGAFVDNDSERNGRRFAARSTASTRQKSPNYGEEKIQSLLQDASIIRCRGKIAGAIQNAKVVLELKEGVQLVLRVHLEFFAK